MIRIGHGFDVHAFGEDRPLIIGGVEVPYHTGFIAHSDGDVALHALTDALLGAVALGDIGKLFPDTDMQYKNAASSASVNGFAGKNCGVSACQSVSLSSVCEICKPCARLMVSIAGVAKIAPCSSLICKRLSKSDRLRQGLAASCTKAQSLEDRHFSAL